MEPRNGTVEVRCDGVEIQVGSQCIAVHRYFGGVRAQLAEVSLESNKVRA